MGASFVTLRDNYPMLCVQYTANGRHKQIMKLLMCLARWTLMVLHETKRRGALSEADFVQQAHSGLKGRRDVGSLSVITGCVR